MEKTTSKKWFLKNIFRKNANKKEIPSADFSSDEEDAKAGFISADFYLKKFSSPKKKSDLASHNNSHNIHTHHVYNPKVNSEFCYFEAPQRSIQQHRPQPEVIYQPTTNDGEYHNFSGTRSQQQPRHYSLSPRCFSNTELSIDYGSQASSQDEKVSCNSFNQQQRLVNEKNEINSSQISAYNDAIALSKKTRAARNQRYYQRLLRDEGRPSTIYGCSGVYDDFNGNQLIFDGDGSIKSTKSASQQPQPRLPGPRNRGATLSDLDDYENILKVDEAVPPPIPPRDPNRRFSMHSSITKNPYYFDQSIQKYVVINKQQPKHETLTKPQQQQSGYVVTQKSDTHQLRSNSTNDLAAVTKATYHDQHQAQPKSYQRYNKQRNLTITEGVKFTPPSQTGQLLYAQSSSSHEPKKFSSFEDINRVRQSSRQQQLQHMNQAGKTTSRNKTNLDDAINELEKMYSRLMSDECLLNSKAPTLDDYSAALIKKYDDYEEEENRTDREPDLVKDDVFSRNIQHANKMSKTIDQLPFGIPNRALQPIPPKPPRDYLSVKPDKGQQQPIAILPDESKPDLIADDLAVRNLRRDNFASSRQIQSLTSESMSGGSNISQILSPVTQKLHLGILSAARRPSGRGGGNRVGSRGDEDERELEESLNALIIESKAISEKLEEDLSKMKATKSINRISSVDLLDFEKKLNQNSSENDVKLVKPSMIKEAPTAATLLGPKPNTKSPALLSTPQKSILKNANQGDIERVRMDVQMVSTACSPIREFAATAAPIEIPKTPTKSSAFVRASSMERVGGMPQASPKISELIQMFSNKESEASSSTPLKPKLGAFKLTPRSKSIDSAAFNIVEPAISSSVPEKPSSTTTTTSQNEFETNIESIRDLIKQMKKTEFDLASKSTPAKKHQRSESREPSSSDFDQKSTTGTESSVHTTTSSLKTFESNESLPKIAIRPDELLTSAIESDAIAIDEDEEDEEEEAVDDEVEDVIEDLDVAVENENVDDNNNQRRASDEIVGEKIVLRDESCVHQHKLATINNDVEKNINEDETTADVDEAKMTLEEKVKKQLENISLNLEKFKDENAKSCNPIVQVLDAESLYNSTEELSMIFANAAENYVSQGYDDDELEVLDADFVAASEKEFEKLALDCNNNNSEIFDNQLLTNGEFALGMCLLSSDDARQSNSPPAKGIINTTADASADNGDKVDACSTQSTTTIPKNTKDNKFHSPPTKSLMKDERASSTTAMTMANNGDGGCSKRQQKPPQQQPKKKPSSSSSSTTSTFNPLSTLQEQAFALACVYFIILLTQLLTFS